MHCRLYKNYLRKLFISYEEIRQAYNINCSLDEMKKTEIDQNR